MKKTIQSFSQNTTTNITSINRYFESISPENRVIFIRRYWFCDTYAEIALRYGISERKAKRHIQKTREHMCDYLGRTWGSFGINHIDAKFVKEAEDVVSLRERKIFPYEYQSIRNDLIDFVLRRFLSFPEHA